MGRKSHPIKRNRIPKKLIKYEVDYAKVYGSHYWKWCVHQHRNSPNAEICWICGEELK